MDADYTRATPMILSRRAMGGGAIQHNNSATCGLKVTQEKILSVEFVLLLVRWCSVVRAQAIINGKLRSFLSLRGIFE